MTVRPPDPNRADRLAHYMLRSVNRAVREHRLIAAGDRVLVAVSGGKDSLTLLDLLHRRQRFAAEPYTLVAGYVESDYGCGLAVPPEWLAGWCAARDIPFHTTQIAVAEEIASSDASPCFRCSWQRRKALLGLADSLGCQSVALGHHADDRVETALLGLFYSAEFRDMAPRKTYLGGRVALIRPLVYLEEREIRAFARASGYPIGGEPCPAALRSKRAVVRRLVEEAEADCRGVKAHILGALGRQGQPSTPVPPPSDARGGNAA